MGLFGNNDRLNTARYNLEQYEKTKPADYQSKYQGQIKDVMGKLENMGDFDYDPDADAAYQQYKNEYTRQAKLANQNAQANAAAMTGGYGSSYGTQAGQNAYARTMNSLDNVLDNLYSQSKAQYNTKKSDLLQQLSGLQSAEKQDYSTKRTSTTTLTAKSRTGCRILLTGRCRWQALQRGSCRCSLFEERRKEWGLSRD